MIPPPTNMAVAADVSATVQSVRVLLIEDNEDDALLARHDLTRERRCQFELEWVPTLDEGIERLRQVSTHLLEAPPPVRLYPAGSWGPKSIHQLIAPHPWLLPFERAWRNPNNLAG